MITENEVVSAVCNHLEQGGYEIVRRATTTDRGPDIVAKQRRDGTLLYVEAKGATSARQGSARFGKPFESAAVRVHVAEAFFTASAVAAAEGTDQAAIALPANDQHRHYLGPVRPAIKKLDIRVFWVDAELVVSLDAE